MQTHWQFQIKKWYMRMNNWTYQLELSGQFHDGTHLFSLWMCSNNLLAHFSVRNIVGDCVQHIYWCLLCVTGLQRSGRVAPKLAAMYAEYHSVFLWCLCPDVCCWSPGCQAELHWAVQANYLCHKVQSYGKYHWLLVEYWSHVGCDRFRCRSSWTL